MNENQRIQIAFDAASETYAQWGVDVQAALKRLDTIEISMQCWQVDDVTGVESAGAGASGGILSTGSYPYKPRSGDELVRRIGPRYIGRTVGLGPAIKRDRIDDDCRDHPARTGRVHHADERVLEFRSVSDSRGVWRHA